MLACALGSRGSKESRAQVPSAVGPASLGAPKAAERARSYEKGGIPRGFRTEISGEVPPEHLSVLMYGFCVYVSRTCVHRAFCNIYVNLSGSTDPIPSWLNAKTVCFTYV